jgi:hypothetical protein
MKKVFLGLMIVALSVSFTFTSSYGKDFKIAAIFQTAIEEPWDGVIHQACLKANKEMGKNLPEEWRRTILRSPSPLGPSLARSLPIIPSLTTGFMNRLTFAV